MRYPTREEILACAVLPTKEDINTLDEWKETWYMPLYQETANTAIKIECLAHIIWDIDGDCDCNINEVKLGRSYNWNTKQKTITLDRNHPSIISTLHEIGHAKFGSNELKACAWSVKLFAEVFPKAYAKLEWHGHMLKKPKAAPSEKGKSNGLKQT